MLTAEEQRPPADEEIYTHVAAEIKPAYRFQLTVREFDFGRFRNRKPRPQPKPNERTYANFQELDYLRKNVADKIADPFWMGCRLNQFSEDSIDRDDMRDLILSRLPVGKLYDVGCVPEYFPYLFNAQLNPFLETHLTHNKEYFPSAFCIREEELTPYGTSHDIAPRTLWAFQTAKKKWVSFPTLDYLPPRVSQMLAGEGGLVLLCGDPPPWVDPQAPEIKTESEAVQAEKNDEKNEEAETGPEEDEGEEGEEEEGEEEVEEKQPDPPKLPPPEPRIDPNGQKLIVVCNPVARTFRILPDMHCHLENLVGHIDVTPTSDHYVVYIVGYHPSISQCTQQKGLRVGIFKSIMGKWRIFSLPEGRLYQPGISNYNRALPLITKNIDTTSIFLSGTVITSQANIHQPVILSFKKKTRSWVAYSWPPASEVEHPQMVECDQKLYICARGVTSKSTMTIWTFLFHEFSNPECKQVTKMPGPLFTKLFPYWYRLRSDYDVVSSSCTISFACRDRPTVIACYDVMRDSWYELPLYQGYIHGLTFLGNWRFEPAAHAQV